MRLLAVFDDVDAFLSTYDDELSNGALLVRGSCDAASAGAECTIVLRVGGDELEIAATVMAVGRTGATVFFDEVPEELVNVVDRLRSQHRPPVRTSSSTALVTPFFETAPTDTPTGTPTGTVAQRLAQLTVSQKFALALAADRETRIALLRDHVKAVHVYVLKNPRVQLDEVVFAAKMSTLSPDALEHIARHTEWGTNPAIVSALVRNPKSPMPLALRLLPKLTPAELRTIAKGGARDQLVQQARRLVSA